jgi:signal transduction histidine kinase
MATSGELRQVFCNLIANSLDVIAENGVIKLRVLGGLHPKTGTRCVRITVADNGTGITSGSMPQLFQPLFTTKGSVGTGLGLWVSKQLIEKHSGSIRVRSCTEGSRHGTIFCILLPAHADARIEDARMSG